MNYKIEETIFEYQNDGDILDTSRLDNYSEITSITILTNIKEIGPYAFGRFCYCYDLKSITIPASVTKICEYAFGRCDRLETLIIPSSVVEIEDNAINPAVRLLILPKKFFIYDHIDTRIFQGTRYKYQWEDYGKKRKTFYYGDQKLDIMLNNLSQLKQYYPFLNSDKTLLQAYKNVSQQYPVLFKVFEHEVLRLDPNFKFD